MKCLPRYEVGRLFVQQVGPRRHLHGVDVPKRRVVAQHLDVEQPNEHLAHLARHVGPTDERQAHRVARGVHADVQHAATMPPKAVRRGRHDAVPPTKSAKRAQRASHLATILEKKT